MLKTTALLILLIGCASGENEQKDNQPESSKAPVTFEELSVTGDLYCQKSKPAYENRGYVHGKCDGAGFTSLYSLRCEGVDLGVFSDSDGKLYRSPSHDCLASGGSKSQSSRDMVLMRAVAAWARGDAGWFEDFTDYVRRNNFVFCDHDGSLDGMVRCTMTPGLFSVLEAAKNALKGKKLDALKFDPLPEKEGFHAHLEVLKIWLFGKAHGSVSDLSLERLRRHAERVPGNALFEAVYRRFEDGDMSKVKKMLGKFPKDRLPTTLDWCEEYKWQREPGRDWEPCPPEKPHSGTAFNTALYIATE